MRKNGCHDRATFAQKRIVQDGVYAYSLTPIPVNISNFSAGAGCQYTLSQAGRVDAGCDGCTHRKPDK